MPYIINQINKHKESTSFAFVKANYLSENQAKLCNIVLAKIHHDRVGQSDFLEAFFPAHRSAQISNDQDCVLLSNGRKLILNEDKSTPEEIDNSIFIFLHIDPIHIEEYTNSFSIPDWVYVPWSLNDLEKFNILYPEAKKINPAGN